MLLHGSWWHGTVQLPQQDPMADGHAVFSSE
jgi:hypothetical protein